MPLLALVPISHYEAWVVTFLVSTFLPSNTLARPSHMVQNGRQNGTERKSSETQFPRVIGFPFENEEFPTFQDSTNEFRDIENIG